MWHHYLKVEKFFVWLLVFIPISIISAIFTTNTTLVFITTVIALVALARVIGFATREIALQTNPTIGGLVSATFGNVIELIIAILALAEGLIRVVQASIIGSILGNILFLIGLSVLFGGLKFKQQTFNKHAVGVSATMLIIAVVGLVIPTVYALSNPNSPKIPVLSDAVAIVLAIVYIAGLIFSLFTHRDLFDTTDEIRATKYRPVLTKKIAAIILFIATIVVAVESEFLVKSIEHAAISTGLTQTFIGVIIIAIATNIAEKTSAINFARENKLDLSIEIGLSSAIQIALFVVPILVLVSEIFHFGFTLVFSLFEVISIVMAVMIINYLSADGKCNWLEGAQLLTVYIIIATAFFFM
ncbi:calcium/proton exchanger [Candidatus Woesearchaeota archaeon]|nr:calcium/proton exchanger [Candidatus Woesearchaeota archaeon]